MFEYLSEVITFYPHKIIKIQKFKIAINNFKNLLRIIPHLENSNAINNYITILFYYNK